MTEVMDTNVIDNSQSNQIDPINKTATVNDIEEIDELDENADVNENSKNQNGYYPPDMDDEKAQLGQLPSGIDKSQLDFLSKLTPDQLKQLATSMAMQKMQNPELMNEDERKEMLRGKVKQMRNQKRFARSSRKFQNRLEKAELCLKIPLIEEKKPKIL